MLAAALAAVLAAVLAAALAAVLAAALAAVLAAAGAMAALPTSEWVRRALLYARLLFRAPRMPAFVVDDASLACAQHRRVARFVASGARAAVVGGVVHEGVGAGAVRELAKARMRVLGLI